MPNHRPDQDVERLPETALAPHQREFYEWLHQPSRLHALAKASALGLDPGFLARGLISALSRPGADRLLDRRCWPSVWRSVTDCIAQGLMPNGIEAAIVPFKEQRNPFATATLIIMYQGMVKLARNEGVIVTATQNVYSNEKFKQRIGMQPPIEHEPLPPSERGEYVGSYALCQLDGVTIGEFMFAEEIDAIRARSKARDSGPWQTDEGEMQKKTVLRRLLKRVPKSAKFSAVLQTDDELDAGLIPNLDGSQLQVEPRTQELTKRVKAAISKPETSSVSGLTEKTEEAIPVMEGADGGTA